LARSEEPPGELFALRARRLEARAVRVHVPAGPQRDLAPVLRRAAHDLGDLVVSVVERFPQDERRPLDG
jgi:hypothetical protein